MKHNIKKISFTLIPLILTFIICSSSFVTRTQAAWGSISGTSTEYLLENSAWIIRVNDLEAGGDGASFNGINIDMNTRYDVDVLDVDDVWGVDFKVTNNTNANSNGLITTDMFYYQFSKFLYHPIEECDRLVNSGFNEEEIERGPPLIQWFFVEPEQDLWDFLDNLTTLDYHNSLPNSQLFEATLQADMEIVEGLVNFDMYMRGTYLNETEDSSVQFDHMIKFVWSEISGILHGYRVATSINGEYQGYTIRMELQMINRKSGYDLPKFKFLSGFIPGFEFLIAIIGIGSVLVLTIIYGKKKKK